MCTIAAILMIHIGFCSDWMLYVAIGMDLLFLGSLGEGYIGPI